MIAEVAIVAALALAGAGVLAVLPGPLPGPARVALALPLGAGLFLMVALVSLAVVGTLHPRSLLLIALVPGAMCLGLTTRARPGDTWRFLLVTLAGAVVVTLITRLIHLTRLTPDSMRYLLAANDLVLPNGITEMNRADLLNRQVGLPSLQALAQLTDRRYLASLSPAFGVSGLGFLTWLSWHASAPLAHRRRLLTVGAAVLFLGASNRLVYDSFYINTHIQMATYLLIAVASIWLAARDRCAAWALPAGVALAATLLFRPEAPLVAAIVLVGMAASRVNWTVRLVTLLPILVVTGLWHGVILWNHANRGNAISLTAPVFGSLAALSLAAVAVAAGGSARLQPLSGHLDKVLYVALIGLLAILGQGRSGILYEAATATVLNLSYYGMWLLTWPVTLLLVVIALLLPRFREAKVWTVPIIGFGLLFWLLPLLRDGPYRVGTGDSGNRLIAHILPVVVAFLVMAAVEKPDNNSPMGG